MNEGISTSICKVTAFWGEVKHLLLSGRLSKVNRALVLTYGMCGTGGRYCPADTLLWVMHMQQTSVGLVPHLQQLPMQM